ncbi:MAG: hypothetical protein ACFFCS_17675 [Candidatus Hodarchaeota archaeon]
MSGPPPMDINAPPSPAKMENLGEIKCEFCGVKLTPETGSYVVNLHGHVQKACKECYFKQIEKKE